jgi:predicted AAA+ superfamily ATPase
MRLVWKSLPSQLARENKKFVYGAVRPGARARDFEESLQWLFDYGAVTKVPRVSSLKMPLEAYEDLSGFKLFCVDVGLLCALSDLNPSAVLDGSRLFTEFKGSLTEQYVLEELVRKGFAPVYWSSSTGTAETNFVIPMDEKVVPIEVKAGENLRSKSLKVACDKFALSRAVRTSLSTYRDEGWLVNIPLWAIGEIRELV